MIMVVTLQSVLLTARVMVGLIAVGGCGRYHFDALGDGGGGGPGCVAAVATGLLHSCAIRTDDTLWCWGDNRRGQLGDGTTTARAEPVMVLDRVAQVSAGEGHTCATRTGGSVFCWGANLRGQLGDGTTIDRSTPVEIMSLSMAVAEVALGEFHSCARKLDGSLWCWGWNPYHALLDPQSAVPIAMTSLPSIALVSVLFYETCVIATDARLWCWGWNDSGQIGNGTTAACYLPVEVTSLGATVGTVSVGATHACARKLDDTLWCWGNDAGGQLGDGGMTDQAFPVEVTALGPSVSAIAAGNGHTCAAKRDGSAWCWGANQSGQLGDGSTVTRRTPAEVASLGGSVASIATGSGFTCARKTDDTLWCWGANDLGQLGIGTVTEAEPVQQVALRCP